MELRKVTGTHQVAVAFPGGASSFVDGPYNKTLSPAHVACCKNTGKVCCKLVKFRFYIGSWVTCYTGGSESGVFRSQKAHGQKNQFSWPYFPGSFDFDGIHSAGCIFLPAYR